MKKALLVIPMLLMICLIGCSSYGDLKGTIVDKQYRKSFTTVASVWNGKFVSTIPIHHPERWQIQISKSDENGEAQTIWISISKEQYEQYEIGDYFEEEE